MGSKPNSRLKNLTTLFNGKICTNQVLNLFDIFFFRNCFFLGRREDQGVGRKYRSDASKKAIFHHQMSVCGHSQTNLAHTRIWAHYYSFFESAELKSSLVRRAEVASQWQDRVQDKKFCPMEMTLSASLWSLTCLYGVLILY